jgi:hypothetical protein
MHVLFNDVQLAKATKYPWEQLSRHALPQLQRAYSSAYVCLGACAIHVNHFTCAPGPILTEGPQCPLLLKTAGCA